MEILSTMSEVEDDANKKIKTFNSEFSRKGIEGLIKFFKEKILSEASELLLSKDSTTATLKPAEAITLDYSKLLGELEAVLKRQTDILAAIDTYARSEEMYRSYILAYGQGAWLGYKTAKIIAQLQNMSLYIWHRLKKDERELQLLEFNEAQGPAIVHMLHTDKFTHFNLLAEPFIELDGKVHKAPSVPDASEESLPSPLLWNLGKAPDRKPELGTLSQSGHAKVR